MRLPWRRAAVTTVLVMALVGVSGVGVASAESVWTGDTRAESVWTGVEPNESVWT